MKNSSRAVVSLIVGAVSFAAVAGAQTALPRYRASVLSDGAQSAYSLSYPRAVSANGLAVGYAWEYGRPSRGWAWDGTSIQYLQPPAQLEGAWTYAHSVNARGVIAGTIEHEGRSFGALWFGGEVTLLDPLNPGDSAGAAAINDAGVVTGGSWPGGIVWRGGSPSALRLIDGANAGGAFLVNNSGLYAGYGVRPGERALPARWNDDGAGEWLVLPSEPAGAQDFVGTQLTGMNQRGDVIGWTTRYGFTGSAQLWRDEELIEIGDFDPENPGVVVPWGINDAAWVVGHQSAPGGRAGAFLWIDGELLDLRDLLEPAAGALELISANGINNDGVIVATAWIDGRQVPVLLTPIPAPGAVGVLLLAGVLAHQGRRR